MKEKISENEKKKITLLLFAIVFIISSVFVVNYFILAWTEPTTAPPVGGGISRYSLDAHDGAPVNAVYVDDNGNMGIGMTNPNYKLDVVGDINLTGILRVNGSPFSGSQWITSGTDIYYNIGDVGIGTVNPSTKLSLASGEIGLGQQNDGTNYLRLGMDTSWTQYLANNAYWTGTEYNYVNTSGYSGLASRIAQVSGTIQLETASGGTNPISWNNRLYIANNGYVGVGKLPAQKLDVAGPVHASGDICTDAGGGKCLSISNPESVECINLLSAQVANQVSISCPADHPYAISGGCNSLCIPLVDNYLSGNTQNCAIIAQFTSLGLCTNPGQTDVIATIKCCLNIGGGGTGSQVYNTPGTYDWTAPGGVYVISVSGIGGGGGGGHGGRGWKCATVGRYGASGGGGGAGLSVDSQAIGITSGVTYSITVGAGGVGGTAGGITTMVVKSSGANVITLSGGAPGGNATDAACFSNGDGGSGGSIGGANGYDGQFFFCNHGEAGANGGAGGASSYGAAGASGLGGTPYNVGGDGGNASGFGAGGGGGGGGSSKDCGSDGQGPAGGTGGSGLSGYLTISW